ncbi:ras-like protein family member 11A [Biomphalaria pfeifferi]|uniref:small monomeric GTPase n=1 Tax=Biomphalaria pfeifferi TaxID=112525 RepID=A0AAD8BPC7_BIOPF|nr:ras-like protein family member 11A [Biomphalaria pfeifferi]
MEDKNHKHVQNGSCRDINIAVLGGKGVGKSAIIVRYLTGRFIGDYDPEMEAIFSTNIPIDGKHYTINIKDTTSYFSGHDLKEDPIFWADAFMLVFSLIDLASYQTVQELVETLRMARDDEGVPILAAANKSDLVHLWTMSSVECEAWCSGQQCLFAEISASEDPESIYKAFELLCKRVRAVHKKREKLSWTLQRPAVAAKLQIRQSLKNLAEKKLWRTRTSTM